MPVRSRCRTLGTTWRTCYATTASALSTCSRGIGVVREASACISCPTFPSRSSSVRHAVGPGNLATSAHCKCQEKQQAQVAATTTQAEPPRSHAGPSMLQLVKTKEAPEH